LSTAGVAARTLQPTADRLQQEAIELFIELVEARSA
jgi:hypothetical protein